VFRLGWIYDFAEAMNGLELWTCKSGNNTTNWCNEKFDALVAQARATQDNPARYELYAQMEQVMFGPDGDMPLAPIYWYTNPNLEKLKIKDTFFIGALNTLDLFRVVVKAED
jgi:oligopeptide transport system substrate-binding protein